MFSAVTKANRRSRGRLTAMFTLLLVAVLCGNGTAFAQAYTSIVVFGDSLSDVGNDAALSRAKYTFSGQVPGPASGYTDGRFTDGTDTLPAAHNYNGVWIEQLAALLTAKPPVTSSLSGGKNYAYGFATTNNGTSPLTYGPGNVFSFTIENMGQQVTDYLATNPTITSNTLFVVWGGANDLLAATTAADIANAASREAALVQRLIAAGATDIIVPNLPPLGLIPRLNGSPTTAVPATASTQAFNQTLAVLLTQLAAANPGKTLHLFPLDIFTLFNTVVGPPPAPGFTNVTAMSQGNATVNPDTYLFWDDLHPTTYGHSLIAASALRLLGPTVGTTVSLTSSASTVSLGSSVTLTATVTGNSGTPLGTVNFFDGTTLLGSRYVSGSTTTATATFPTPPLASGTRSLTAAFAGVNGFGSATSAATTVTVVPPSFAATLSPATLTIARGATGMSTITVAPAGGYTGTFTVACGTVANITCSVGAASLAITTTTAASTTVTIGTANVSANRVPALPGGPLDARVEYGFLGLSLLTGLTLARKRAARLRSMPLLLLALLSLALLTGLAGCGGSDPLAHDTPAGTYQVPITVTPASGAATTLNVAVTVQ